MPSLTPGPYIMCMKFQLYWMALKALVSRSRPPPLLVLPTDRSTGIQDLPNSL